MGSLTHSPWALLVLALLALVMKLHGRANGPVGGAGRVVGIVGRMGSGKSYFAVRMAYRRMRAGANVCSNFTMKFSHAPKCRAALYLPSWSGSWVEVRAKKGKCHRHCTMDMAGRWSRFHGWAELATLENAVVIVDEAHIMAPSLNPHAIPEVAKWKLSMARKYRLDLYWITQHEDRVTRVLRDLTNIMYVCSSWFGALAFTAKGYEPEKMRRKDAHIERRTYRFNLRIANLYDTLEVLKGDALVSRDGTMELANELADSYNTRRGNALAVKAGKHVGAVVEVDDYSDTLPQAKPRKKAAPRKAAPKVRGAAATAQNTSRARRAAIDAALAKAKA